MALEPTKISRYKCERLAAPLLTIVKAAFEDPKIVEEFKEWQKRREIQQKEANI